MKKLRGKFYKWLAWLFWKLHIITEKDYVNFLITLKADEERSRRLEEAKTEEVIKVLVEFARAKGLEG